MLFAIQKFIMNTFGTWLWLLLLICWSIPSSSTATMRSVHNCECQRNGNRYMQLTEHQCEKFAQYDNITRLTHTHICPKGLSFSVDTCVCVYSHEVTCEGCGPPVCEVVGAERFNDILNLQKAGDCLSANKISREIVFNCVVKDPVARILSTLRFIAARLRETQCPSPLTADGCESISECMALMLAPENNKDGKDRAPKFLCENYKEARRCLICGEDRGCQLAAQYRENLRLAAAELCPHIQEFVCPAV